MVQQQSAEMSDR